MEINRKNVGVGAIIGAAVLCGLSRCDEKERPKKHKNAPSIVKERNDVNEDLRKVLDMIEAARNLKEAEDQGDYTVAISLDENGDISENFNPTSAVRDCVESTGKYHCQDYDGGSGTTCYRNDPLEGQMPVDVVRLSNMWNGIIFDEPELWGLGVWVFGEEPLNHYLNFAEVGESQSALNGACKSAVELLETSFDVGEHYSRSAHMDIAQYNNDSYVYADELFNLIEENGFEVKDRGGEMFTLDWGGGFENVIYMDSPFGLDGLSRNYDVQTNNANHSTFVFDNPDDLVKYLIEAESGMNPF